MDEFLKGPWAPVVLFFLVAGSVVDLAQFLWLVRRSIHKARRAYYNKVRREILEGKKNG